MKKIKFNVWLEDEEGGVLLSRWRVRLLEAIESTGSINMAAEEMDITYARAWDKIRQSEERLGIELISTQKGGRHGGGTSLTPRSEEFIQLFKAMYEDIERVIREHEPGIINLTKTDTR